jgi:WD40 repeat protein
LIQIYATYTCEPLAVFRGHTGNVKSLFWSLDDTSIVSAGWDGAVYERKLNNAASRHQEFVQKGIKFHSALCTEDGKIYATGHDMVLREIIDRNVHKKLSTGSELTQVLSLLVISHFSEC